MSLVGLLGRYAIMLCSGILEPVPGREEGRSGRAVFLGFVL